jgi:CubicO group peptidase (beta-lactamase class C family)
MPVTQSRKHSRVAACIVVAATLITSAACASAPRATGDAQVPNIMSALDSIFAAYAEPGRPGAGVLVVKDGQVVASRSYGLADVDQRTPASDATNYRLASLSKQFTATAMMLLVRDGRLRLDDRVSDLLPGMPAHGRDVTIRHLLTHTSGLWAYEDFVPRGQTEQVKDRDVPALIQRAESLYFAPGSTHRYSNTGYALLALIVERLSGQPYAKFLEERIFRPAGMRGTVAFETGISTVPNRAFGYSIRNNAVVPSDQSSTSAVLGDGGVYSSLRDMLAWDRALDARMILLEDELRQAWTPMVLSDGTVSRYGFGWFVDREDGTLRLSHHGETSGFTNFILKYPERRLTVLVLTNRRGGAPWDLAARVAALPALGGSGVPRNVREGER